MEGQGTKELIFCATQSTPYNVIDKAVSIFTEKKFSVRVARPEQEMTFGDVLKAKGSVAVCDQLEKAEKIFVNYADTEIKSILMHFEKLDNELRKAENQPYAVHRVLANEAIEKYANDVGKNASLLSKIKINQPGLGKLISTILEKGHGIEL